MAEFDVPCAGCRGCVLFWLVEVPLSPMSDAGRSDPLDTTCSKPLTELYRTHEKLTAAYMVELDLSYIDFT